MAVAELTTINLFVVTSQNNKRNLLIFSKPFSNLVGSGFMGKHLLYALRWYELH